MLGSNELASVGSFPKRQGITFETIVSRARDMVPLLRERAGRTEILRRIPPETHGDFTQCGLYRVLMPARYDGYELDYGIHTEMSYHLARGCASSGWVATIIACHSWLLGMFPGEAQEKVWGEDRDALVASAFHPTNCRVERVNGGYRIGGRWPFSSGVDLCKWIILGTPVRSEKGLVRLFSLVPLSDCTIEDTWFVTGLAGTGSNDVIVHDLFVPDAHTVDASGFVGGETPGSAINPGHIYRLPLFGVFSYSLVGVCVGAAQGMLENVTNEIKLRSSPASKVKLSSLQSVQLRLAKASAAVDAAHVIITRNCEEMNRLAVEGTLNTDARVRWRRDAAFAALLAVDAVDEIEPLLGAKGLQVDNAGYRAWRDVHAISQHMALKWDSEGTSYGQYLLGISPEGS